MPSFPSKNEVLEIVLKRKTKSKPTWILFLPTTRFKIVELEYYLSAKHCKKLKISIKNLFSKCDHIDRKLQVWSHLLKKALMENFSFCAIQRHKSVKGCRYYLVSSRVEPPPFFLREPSPFWVPLFFWSRLKKLPHSFWEPSKLLDADCINQFKTKVLRFVLLN